MIRAFQSIFAPRQAAEPQVATPERAAARDMVSLCGKPDEHKIMTENVAVYVAHLKGMGVGVKVESDYRSQLSTLKDALCEAGHPKPGETQLQIAGRLRWLSKLQRDIQAPYSDKQVGERLKSCSGELKSILGNFGEIAHEIHLVGGPLAANEGRFGGHSDLDLVMVVEDKDRARADKLAESLSPCVRDRKDTLQVYVTSQSQQGEVFDYFGPHEKIDESKIDANLRDKVREGLQTHGLELRDDFRARRVADPELHATTELKRFPSALVTPIKL